MQSYCILMVAVSAVLTEATLDPDGVKCGDKRCATVEYCSPYDTQCRPCSIICDPDNHNRQPEICVEDCQEYLHDQRYVLRSDLGNEIARLQITVTVLISVVCFLILGITLFVCSYFVTWKKAKSIISKTWRNRRWLRKPKSSNKIQVDVETAGMKQQNGLRITMPTISGMVTQSPNSSCKDGSCNGNATPSTSSTTLSRKIPSEDSTVEYAYDNPAMTPSPEVTQQRTKRESSF